MNDILSVLNAIEGDIQSIRIAEDILNMQHDSELSASRKENLRNSMNLINETLKKNKQKLAELQGKLDASSINSSSLQKTFERLSNDMKDKAELVVFLQNELDKKEVHIEALTTRIEDLHTDVKELEEINHSHVERISEQDEEMNTVYYCFGTKKELKEQNILTGTGLFSKSKALQGEFNRDYFIAIDKRTLSSIPLYSSKVAVKTNHPADSYQIVKDSDGFLTLKINNPTVFWNLSNFLVIEIR